MINPNKTYRTKSLGKITKLINTSMDLSGFWFEVEIAGQKFEGYLNPGETNYGKLNVGDQVRCGASWSITGDHWLIRTISKVREKV